MSRNGYRGPKLPGVLLDRVQNGNVSKKRQKELPRKDRRRAERQQKRGPKSRPSIASRGAQSKLYDESLDGNEGFGSPLSPEPAPKEPAKDTKPLKSILKKAEPDPPSESEEDAEEEEEQQPPKPPVVSRAAKGRIVEDDAEIAALERKLGIKGKNSKALEKDGLSWLVDGSNSESEDGSQRSKRKRPEDAKWLRDKRVKADGTDQVDDNDEDGEVDVSDVEEEKIGNPFSEDGIGSDNFEGFDSEGSSEEDENELSAPAPKKQRENPYAPPVAKDEAYVAKYVPPSLRKPANIDEETLKQLQRQVQGLLNRLSEANLLSILQSLEDLYIKNARQHVTSTLVDLLTALVSDPSILNDTFLILHAGFSTAVYKVVGTDFGAQLLENIVESFDHHRARQTDGKQTLNLIAFLSCLYTFQLVGSSLIFDYIRLLLEEISESNAELLLRIIRTSGQQLRQDDPSSLKDIVLLLQRSVAKVREEQLSVRTKSMIETINNLKNNRMKTGASASTVATEHTTRLKKTLGSLNTSRSIKATEPLRITLHDIRDSEKKGKWWLVGASYHDPAKMASSTSTRKSEDLDAGYESETPGSVNLHKLARTQGMNTEVRRSIFITLLSSSDYKEAHIRLLKLHLKNKQMLEIPRVLVHCAGAEQSYNHFYALVARQFCGEHRLRKAFHFALWDVLKRMEESEEEDGGARSVRKVVNLAKFYGRLIADGGLVIAVLKKLDFTYLSSKAGMFAEVLLTSVFVDADGREQNPNKDHPTNAGNSEKVVHDIFMRAAGAPEDFLQGLPYFLKTAVAKAELGNGKKESRAIQKGCQIAVQALEEAARAMPTEAEDNGDDSD